jgi:hypothetical protein
VRTRLKWIGLGLVFLTLACGKNQAIYPIGSQPLYQAPGMNGGYYPGSGMQAFNPQMPSGYPAAYTPFLPVDYFMRNNPQYSGYWAGYWQGWQSHCNRYGYSPYDFNYFWYVYTPYYWNQMGYGALYNYFNQSFYSWASPQVQIATSVSPASFWVNYQGMGYGAQWWY